MGKSPQRGSLGHHSGKAVSYLLDGRTPNFRLISDRIKPSQLCILILVIVSLFYFSGIGFDLPYLKIISDEDFFASMIMEMVEEGKWNPEWFFYPPLYYYVSAIIIILFKLVSAPIIHFFGIKDVINGILSDYPRVALYCFGGRFLSALFGFLTCLAVFKLTKDELKNNKGAYLSLFFMALSPILIFNSHHAKPDSLQVLFIFLVFYLSLLIYEKGKWRYPIVAGILTSAAFLTKYSGVTVGAVVALSLFLRFLEKKDSFMVFLGKAFLSFFSFLFFIPLFSPFTILDFKTFKQDFYKQIATYQTDPLILSENSWTMQMLNIYRSLGILPTIFLIIGLALSIRMILKKEFKHLILISFPILFYFQLGITNQWVDRHLLPAIPFLIIISSSGFSWGLRALEGKKLRILNGIFIILFFLQPFWGAFNLHILFHQKDPKHENREWVNKNIPTGVFFAFEERTGIRPIPYSRLYYSFGEAPFEGFLESAFELLFVSESIKAQHIEGRKKSVFPRHAEAYRWIDENSYLIRVIGKKSYDKKPKIFLYKLKGKSLEGERNYRLEISGENKGGNLFMVMISKEVVAKIFPYSRFDKSLSFSFRDGIDIPLFIFTPVDTEGRIKDTKGSLNFSLKIFDQNGELLDSINSGSIPNNPFIHLVKLKK